MLEDADFTDALATVVFATEPGGLSTAAVTRHLTRAIVTWASARGWRVRTEARVNVPDGAVRERLGFVDVVIGRGVPHRDVAIEIDSTDKPWSVVKLQHAAAAGMHAIWVRWGDEAWAGVYDGVDVIQLPMIRRSKAREGIAQLTLWR